MRILALDIGAKRVGLAVSDTTGTVASPLAVLPTCEVEGNAPSFRRVLEDYEPDMLLFGLPLSLSGEESEQTQAVREAAHRIAARAGLPKAFQDERLSSGQAKRILRESGFSERTARGKIDMIAASVFLQTYLDSAQGNEDDTPSLTGGK